MGGVTLNASVTAKSAVPFFSFPLFHAFPQAPLRSFAPVFSRSAISTIQKGTACSLGALALKTERREYCSPVNIKMKCVYNYCVQSCVFYASIPVPSICNQSIPIYLSVGIDNQYNR